MDKLKTELETAGHGVCPLASSTSLSMPLLEQSGEGKRFFKLNTSSKAFL